MLNKEKNEHCPIRLHPAILGQCSLYTEGYQVVCLSLRQAVHMHLSEYAESLGASSEAADTKVCGAQF